MIFEKIRVANHQSSIEYSGPTDPRTLDSQQRGRLPKLWISEALREGKCKYCHKKIIVKHTTKVKKHLLNEAVCTYLSSSDALSNSDPEVVMVLIANGRKVEEGPMNAIPSVSRPSCDSKRGFDSETSPKSAGHDELDEGIQKHSKIRKLWLHTAVYPAPGGGSNGHICRYCGTLLVSQNVSVRKKHLLNPKICRYLFSPDAAANSDPEVQRSLHSPLVLGAKQAPLQLDVAVYGVADMPAAKANANATPRMLQQPVKAVDTNLPNPSSPAAPCASSTSSLRSIMELLAKDESNDEYWGLDTSAPTSSCDSLHTSDSVSRCDRDEADDPVINEMVLKAKALMLQQHQLLQENVRTRAKISVLNKSISAQDEHLHHLILDKTSFSRQAMSFFSTALRFQFSIEAVPPPSQWNVGWRAWLKDLGMDSHLAIANSFVIQSKAIKDEIYRIRMIRGDSSSAERRMQGLIEKRLAMSRFMLNENPYIILSSVGRNMITGKEGEIGIEWWRSIAEKMYPYMKDSYWPLLRAAMDLFNTRVSAIMAERRELIHQLNHIINHQSSSMAQGSMSSSQGEARNEIMPLATDGLTVDALLTWLMKEDSVEGVPSEANSSLLPASLGGYDSGPGIMNDACSTDGMICTDFVLAKLQKTYEREGFERAMFSKASTEVTGQDCTLFCTIEAYPYIIDLPCLTQCCLDEFDRRNSSPSIGGAQRNWGSWINSLS